MSRRAATFTQSEVARAIRDIQQVAPGKMMVEIAPAGVMRILPLDSRGVRGGTPEPPDMRLRKKHR
jgi:hypothetical protein